MQDVKDKDVQDENFIGQGFKRPIEAKKLEKQT